MPRRICLLCLGWYVSLRSTSGDLLTSLQPTGAQLLSPSVTSTLMLHQAFLSLRTARTALSPSESAFQVREPCWLSCYFDRLRIQGGFSFGIATVDYVSHLHLSIDLLLMIWKSAWLLPTRRQGHCKSASYLLLPRPGDAR
jgi:hypothetical protein